MDRKRKMSNELKQSIPYKRRKLDFARRNNQQQKSTELREGTTYQSSVDLTEAAEDVVSIPPPIQKPKYKAISTANLQHVCFDLETTGLESDCEILQIAASTLDGKSKFNVYVKIMGTVPASQCDRLGNHRWKRISS
jgi:DNA polymerase III epsilon subunit-like protein